MTRFGIALLTVATTLIGSTLARAQPVAESPAPKIGDKWTFQQKLLPDGTDRKWSRQVSEIATDGKITTLQGNGAQQVFDSSWNFIDPKGSEYSFTTLKFPMKVGAEWSYSARVGAQGILERQGKYKVVAYEPLTVPAGTFDCFHVQGGWTTSGRRYNQQATDNYWYCPKLNFIGKRVTEISTTAGDTLPTKATDSSELANFVSGT